MLISIPKPRNTLLVWYSQKLMVDELSLFNASSTSSFCLQKIIHLQREDTASVGKPCIITVLSKAHSAVWGADPGQQESTTQPPSHCPLQHDWKRIIKAQVKKKLVGRDKDRLKSKENSQSKWCCVGKLKSLDTAQVLLSNSQNTGLL